MGNLQGEELLKETLKNGVKLEDTDEVIVKEILLGNEVLQELLTNGVEKYSIMLSLDMTLNTLESRISKDNFTDSEKLILKKLNS